MARRTARHTTNYLMALCAICLIMFSPLIVNSQDPWAFFHPEAVRSFGCKVTDTTISYHGEPQGDLIWQATAFANRKTDAWQMDIGRFPHNVKGRHSAEKACMKWQDEAEKRVYGAQGK